MKIAIENVLRGIQTIVQKMYFYNNYIEEKVQIQYR